jgi:hypothetical protein
MHHNEHEYSIGFLRKILQKMDRLSNELSDFVLGKMPDEERAWYTQTTSSSASESEASEPSR